MMVRHVEVMGNKVLEMMCLSAGSKYSHLVYNIFPHSPAGHGTKESEFGCQVHSNAASMKSRDMRGVTSLPA